MGDYLSPRKRFAPSGKHIPNSDESKLLRHLMTKSGLKEKDVRKNHEYRVQLAEARRAGTIPLRSRSQKAKDAVMKSITRRLKLAKEHPLVQAAYRKELAELQQQYPTSFYRTLYG